MDIVEKNDLQRISNILMLHESSIKKIGLMNGKMGIIIFFFHLSKFLNRKLYSEFAGEMIDELYEEISLSSSTNFEDGLSGIAWGIEYLIQNKFVQADANEILCDLDQIIIERDVRRIYDLSLETGLKGIANYVISRCADKNRKEIILPEDYIKDLIIALGKHENLSREFTILKNIMQGNAFKIEQSLLLSMVADTKYNSLYIFDKIRDFGINNNGYAGIGLYLILNEK